MNTLKTSFHQIYKTFLFLHKNQNEIKAGSGAEWLCDNFYILEQEYNAANAFLRENRHIKKDITEMKAFTETYFYTCNDCFEESTLRSALTTAQKTTPFRINALKALPFSVRCVLLAHAAQLCKNIENDLKMERIIRSFMHFRNVDFQKLFEEQSMMDRIFSNDPIYNEMTSSSKTLYRKVVIRLAKETKTSEWEIAEKILKLTKNQKGVKAHVGYYLLGNGEKKMRNALKLAPKKDLHKTRNYILAVNLLTLLFTFGIWCITKEIIWTLLSIIPTMEIIITLLQYLLLKTTPVKILPSLKLENGINERILVVYPTLLSSVKKATEMAEKLEICYLANRDDNLHFAILGDFKDSKEKNEDLSIIEACQKEITSLNQRYGERFYFLQRGQVYRPMQKKWMGMERKRGAITDLNAFLLGDYTFQYTAGKVDKLVGIQYVLTLDDDTTLPPGGAHRLAGTALHPLNQPVIKNGIVTEGYGIIQPRISVRLKSASKTLFSRIWAGQGGIDTYHTAVSEFYMDVFGETVFTGKGLYHVETFKACMSIPADTVLSHDLLEGSYVRCALASDVQVFDGFPHFYSAFALRQHRWIRGDWQIIPWLFPYVKNEKGQKVKNPLMALSKWKITENLRRSLTPIFLLILIILGNERQAIAAYISLFLPILLYLIDALLEKSYIYVGEKIYSPIIYGFRGMLYQVTLAISFLAYEAYMSFDAICKGIYRTITHRKSLEWITASDAESVSNSSFSAVYTFMMPSFLIGVISILLYLGGLPGSGTQLIFGIIWILAPVIAFITSNKTEPSMGGAISGKANALLYETAEKTWNYFKDYMNAENHFLPPDNVQIKPYKGVAYRTSPTNIGLGMVAALCAFRFGFIDKEEFINRITKSLETIDKLETWKGHLYNWYDTKSCTPLPPRYISTVDSGNFVCYLLVLMMGIKEEFGDKHPMVERIHKMIYKPDFKALYDEKKHLFSIGFSVEDNSLTNSYYDLLASEARQASFIAIVLGQIPPKHWFRLGRGLTSSDGYKGLISWSGTMFEYFMPALIMKSYHGTLLDETYHFAVSCQKKYGQKRHVPWGVSESGFYAFDNEGNYQYKAFGVPILGLVRNLSEDTVIAPYATFLALQYDTRAAINNLFLLKKNGMYGEYGFYESVDYTKKRMHGNMHRGIVKSYMAHHQGMVLASITNFLKDDALKTYFHAYPPVKATQPLLEERIPVRTAVMKERRERIEPIRPSRKQHVYTARKFNRINTLPRPFHLLSNGSYHLLIDSHGNSRSTLHDISFNKFTPVHCGGEYIYIVNTNSGDMIDGYGDKCVFYPHAATYYGSYHGLETNLTVSVCPEDNCQARRLTILNHTGKKRVLDIYYYTEVSLTTKDAATAHNAFANLFVQTKMQDATLLATRRKRTKNEKTFVGFASLLTEATQIGAMQYDTDRLSFCGRGACFPEDIKVSNILGEKTGTVLDPCFALKVRIEIESGESGSVTFLSGMSENEEKALRTVEKYRNTRQNFVEDARKYSAGNSLPELNPKVADSIMHIAGYMLYGNNLQMEHMRRQNQSPKNALWKLGISGDHPILTCKIATKEKEPVLDTLLDAHHFWNERGFKTDLIILCDEPSAYNMPVYQMAQSKRKSGIFIFRRGDLSDKDRNLILAASSVYIDAENHKPFALPPYPKFDSDIKPVKKNTKDISPALPSLAYFNEYGGFDPETLEYVIVQKKRGTTPMPWSHIVANPNFGFLITESGGGNTWSENSHAFRLTPWLNDSVRDPLCEKIIVQEKDDLWSPFAGVFNEEGVYVTRYGFGYAAFSRITRNIEHEAILFVPPDENKKVVMLTMKNNTEENRVLSASYTAIPVLGEKYNPDDVIVTIDKNIIYAKNPMIYPDRRVYLTGGKESICFGDNHEMQAQVSVTLGPKETKTLTFVFGTDENPDIDALSLLNKTKEWWRRTVQGIVIESNNHANNYLYSGWLLYQSVACRMFAKSAFYQSGGATGYRDQLQDALALLYTNASAVKDQILYHAAHQFKEGDVFHWWHNDGRGVRTRFSDDRLWLPYAACLYTNTTKDASIWDELVSFVDEPVLSANEEERYTFISKRTTPYSLYEHAIRAIDISLQKGRHSLPLMGGGDWNDGMNEIGIKGEGESVWLAWFLKHVLDLMVPICRQRGDSEKADVYAREALLLVEAIECAWDTDHYARAYFDSGAPVGTSMSEECTIDAISQAWSVIAKGGSVVRSKTAMQTLYNTLIDKEHNIIRLLAPPFANSKESPGYIQSYPKGIRENGGQYTHAAIWVNMAFAMLGDVEKANELFRMLNPILRSATKKEANIYKTEPYVMTADIYTAEGHVGRGGWSWYTGAAAWMYRLGITNMYGFQKEGEYVSFHPCLESNAFPFVFRYHYKETLYIFHVFGPSEKPIHLLNDKQTHEITIGKDNHA